MTIPESDWVWCGYAGHFIGGHNCRFHLTTMIGPWSVSTVGDYYPSSGARTRLGGGEDDWYETMIFPIGEPDDDNPHGKVEVSGLEWMKRYSTVDGAEAGHLSLCRKVADGWNPGYDSEAGS